MKKDKKYKFDIKKINNSLNYLSLNCCWHDVVQLKPEPKPIMVFDNDEKGNGNGPYLEIEFLPYHAKIIGGDLLSKKERATMGDFIAKYFKSFSLKLIRKKS